MTYDLHGQWDAGNKWSSPGCSKGNCLRSHINYTETYDALAMITKAGVPANKVIVGIASYGRSFQMAEPGCFDPDCHFTGDRNNSNAMPGRCTGTPGYLGAAEIREIIKDARETGGHIHEYHDNECNSDIVVFDETEWVAWMSDKTKETRISLYKSYNFGGVTDWAVDLDKGWWSHLSLDLSV